MSFAAFEFAIPKTNGIKEHKAAQPKNIHKRNSCALRGEEEADDTEQIEMEDIEDQSGSTKNQQRLPQTLKAFVRA